MSEEVKPQFATKIIPIKVSGNLVSDGSSVSQDFSFPVPREVSNDQISLFVWEALSRTAGLNVFVSEGEYKFYPFHLFDGPLRAIIKEESGVSV